MEAIKIKVILMTKRSAKQAVVTFEFNKAEIEHLKKQGFVQEMVKEVQFEVPAIQ